MTECPHGLDDPAWCSLCKRAGEKPESVTVEATFRTRYEGQCPSCNLPVVEGQTIHRLSNDSYVHQGCE